MIIINQLTITNIVNIQFASTLLNLIELSEMLGSHMLIKTICRCRYCSAKVTDTNVFLFCMSRHMVTQVMKSLEVNCAQVTLIRKSSSCTEDYNMPLKTERRRKSD